MKFPRQISALLFFAFWAVLIACGGAGGNGTGSGGNGGFAANSITYTSANQANYPNLNGTFTFSASGGDWLSFGGFDDYTLNFHTDTEGRPRVSLFIQTPSSTPLAAGQSYSWANSGVGWSFGSAASLSEPNPTSNILLYSNEGTLIIKSVTNNADGSKKIDFEFSYGTTSSIYGTGSGSATIPQVFPS